MHKTIRLLKVHPITGFMKMYSNLKKCFDIFFWFKYTFLTEFKVRIFDKTLLPKNSVSFEGLYYSNRCFLFFTDAALTFSSANTASVAENTAAETEIIQVVATGGTAPYSYTIAVVPAGLASWVEIANTDKLRIATGATIDYEDATLVSASYDLTITIT